MIEIRKRITLKTSKCPNCRKKNLKRILWGMPSSQQVEGKFIIGGCCVPENPPEIGCTSCDWTGWRGEIVPKSRTFRDRT